MEMPFCKFYPRDWLGDPQLRMMSLASRGLWADMLCLMGCSERRGYLEVGGVPVTDASTLARLVGSSADEVASCLVDLERASVFSRDDKGTIFSRRIVRDIALSEQKREAGLRGGNPALLKQDHKQGVKHEVEQPAYRGAYTQRPETRDQRPESRSQISESRKDVGESDRSRSSAAASPASASKAERTAEQLITELQANPAYAGVDVAREFAKMNAWCKAHRKQPSERRFIGWLNRIDRQAAATPIQGEPYRPMSPDELLKAAL